MVSNGELEERVGARAFNFSSKEGRAAVGHVPGPIVERAYLSWGSMLLAVIKHPDADDASLGFWSLVQQVGPVAPKGERLAFWTEQLRVLGLR